MLNLFGSEELALGGLERGVTYHARSTPHKSQRLVSGHLKMLKEHDAHKMADMEGVGRGVDTNIGGDHFA